MKTRSETVCVTTAVCRLDVAGFRVELLLDPVVSVASLPGPASEVPLSERLRRARYDAVNVLPLTSRQKLLLLHKLDGWSHRKVAREWGVSRQSVERLWARCKRRLSASREKEEVPSSTFRVPGEVPGTFGLELETRNSELECRRFPGWQAAHEVVAAGALAG